MSDDWGGSGTPRRLTVRDLELMPADGQRYELLDGVLLVSPVPEGRYQQVADVQGDEVFVAVQPFPVEIVPGRLLGRLGGEG